jgi:hypothetical protein
MRYAGSVQQDGRAQVPVTRTSRLSGRAARIIALLLLALSLPLLLGAGYAVWSELAFRRIAVETDGRVVEMIREVGSSSNSGRRTATYRPVFVFSPEGGKEVRAQGSFASNPPCCSVGERVRVRYDPARPESAAMVGFMQSWLVAMILGGIGVVFAGIGLAMRRVGPTQGAVVPAAAPAQNTMTFAVPLVGLRRDGGMRWVLQARWADPRSGVQRLFESEPLPFDPVPQMRGMSAVNIAFDPGQPDGPYWMDLSFLREPDADATVVQRRG